MPDTESTKGFDNSRVKPCNTNPLQEPQEPKFVLSQREAQAASPADMAVCGEEDPGEGAEFLVMDSEQQEKSK